MASSAGQAYAKALQTDPTSAFGGIIAFNRPLDGPAAEYVARQFVEVLMAPAFTPEALAVFAAKPNVRLLQIELPADTAHAAPAARALEYKRVGSGLLIQTADQHRLQETDLQVVTEKRPTPQQMQDLLFAWQVAQYVKSNAIVFCKDGMTVGVGAGQQSRVHCTRLAGNKADIWWLRQHPKVLALPFKDDVRRPERDNTIDVYISDDYEDVLADGMWQAVFTDRPEPLTRDEKKAWLKELRGVALGSDAFFPFGDNIERAHRSGVAYIAQSGGSIRDDHVIATCDKYNIAMAMTGVRLFHH